jgi:hypothetical protein
MTEFFDFAEKNRFALFPCAQGTKRPILKWKSGSTHDRALWETWQSEHNNLAIDCAKSEILMIDVDSSKVTREEAWGAYGALCFSWGLTDPAMPMTQSARGGWHIPFRRPASLAATDLRGGGTLVKISDIRPLAEGEEDGEVVGFKNRGYCVAPGSNLSTATGNLPYMLMTDPPAPHEAPEGLLDQVKLKVIEATYSGQTGTSDKADVAKLVAELDMFGEFSTEPDWWKYMGAIKLALGDTDHGVEVALQMTTDDATAEAFWSRWKRLASVDDGGPKCRINSMIHRYKELTDKHFNVRTSVAAMFEGVAQHAAANGATGMPRIPIVESGEAPLQPTRPGFPLPSQDDQYPAPAGGFMQRLGDRLRSFVLPEYLWDGILMKRFCYSLTAQTGVGKTAMALLIAAHVAIGKALCGLDVEKGTVIYFAGENPVDVDMRWFGLCQLMGLDPDAIDVHIIAGVVPLSKVTGNIGDECEVKLLRPSLVIVDTAAAYFEGDEENGNTAMGNYARQLRELCKLPGEPCVLVLAHPTKGANEINEMVPRGGGAFLNEMDGNIGAARGDGGLIGIQATGKFRGPEFTPLHFALHSIRDVPALFNEKKGKHLPTVVAQPVTEAGAAARAMESDTADIRLVRFIDANPKASFVQIAAEFKTNKSRAERMVQALITEKLVKRDALTKKLTLTPTAQRAVNELEAERNRSEAIPMPFPPISRPEIA